MISVRQGMLKACRYVFYRCYLYQLTRWDGNEPAAVGAAAACLFVPIFLNALSIGTIVYALLSWKTMAWIIPPKLMGSISAMVALVFYVSLTQLFAKDDAYKEMVKEFGAETAEHKSVEPTIYGSTCC